MLKIVFNNLSKSPLKKSFLQKIAKVTIARSGVFDLTSSPSPYKGEGGLRISISFASVSEKEMQRLNKIYRRKNMPTDVLSFAEYGNQKEIKNHLTHNPSPYKGEGGLLFLGEIILCYNNIAEYSKKNKLNLKKEIAKVVSHGVLHLLGFRHGGKMYKIQNSPY